MASPFNDYDESGFRLGRNGNRTSKVEDEAIIRNLRFAWGDQIAHLTDRQLVDEYDDFALSDMWGDNDARWMEWVAGIVD